MTARWPGAEKGAKPRMWLWGNPRKAARAADTGGNSTTGDAAVGHDPSRPAPVRFPWESAARDGAPPFAAPPLAARRHEPIAPRPSPAPPQPIFLAEAAAPGFGDAPPPPDPAPYAAPHAAASSPAAPSPAEPPAAHARPWRDAAEALLHRLDPPSLAELRAHWPAFTLRAVTYSGAILLAGSLLLATLPPILSDTSTRAVVNAPVALVTAPIDGELDRLLAQPGEAVGPGQVLAHLRNERLDRSTLIGLQNQTAGTRVAVSGLEQRLAIAESWVVTLEAALSTHRAHALRMAQEGEREARAKVAAAGAAAAEQSALANRQRILFERGVVTETVFRIAQMRERGAREELIAAEATLARRVAEHIAVETGSYVGDGQGALGALVERRRDTILEINRMKVERQQLASSLASLEAQTRVEEERFNQQRAAQAVSTNGGHILRAFASPGQRLTAGDTIAGTVECGRAFVVAIFSVRQAHRLGLGTRVRIEADGWEETRHGVVVQVLPRTTDRVDTGYAVPFPPMERREMYVLVEFDERSPRRWSRGYESRLAPSVPCDIGRWVSVEVDGNFFGDVTTTAWRWTRGLVVTIFGRAEASPMQDATTR